MYANRNLKPKSVATVSEFRGKQCAPVAPERSEDPHPSPSSHSSKCAPDTTERLEVHYSQPLSAASLHVG
jgi:hypothetical protein